MFGRRRTPWARPSFFHVPYWPSYTGSLAVVLSLCRRDRNRMYSYRVSTVDVPEYPIASGARGQWQQRCDTLQCHEECRGSAPPRLRTYPCYRVVYKEHQQKCTSWWCKTPSKNLAKVDTYGSYYVKVHKCSTPENKAMSEISNCCH